jgi:hypothetical protein
VNPQRREEILRQGTFFVHPPGEPETISTRVLILEEGGELFYRRYPGQPEPRKGQWF